jgi:hypothetical protein
VGYADIVVQWDQSSQPTSSRWGQFQYSIDGTTFLDFGPLIENVRTSFDIWDNGHVRDLSAVSGVANNPNFAFRIVAAFALPANTSYQAITGSYNLNDFWAFDMVTVSGETYIPPPSGVPEPASCLLLGVALLGGVAVRLRSRNSAIRRTGQTC